MTDTKEHMMNKLSKETNFGLFDCRIALQNENLNYERALAYLTAKDILKIFVTKR